MDQNKIGQFISELRRQKGLTQKSLAEKIGVTDRAISKWENGRGLPDYSSVKPLCDELGITLNELLEGERIQPQLNEERLQENMAGMYQHFSQRISKLNLTRLILSITVCCFLAVGCAFLIDLGRMANGKPVIFSNWGMIYVPEVNLESEQIDGAIRKHVVDYEISHQKQGRTPGMNFAESHIFQIVDNKDESYTVYAWILEETYVLENGEAVVETGSSMPRKFTLIRHNDGSFIVTGDEYVGEGADYQERMNQLFPKKVLKQITKFEINGGTAILNERLAQQKDIWFSYSERKSD